MSSRVALLLALAAVVFLVWVLGGVLTPFLVAAAFAYLFDPLVDRLERLGAGRTLSVTVVFAFALVILAIAAFFIVPAIQAQLTQFIQNIPRYVDQIREVVEPWMEDLWPGVASLDAQSIRQLLADHWSSAKDVASTVAGQLFSSGSTLFTLVVYLFLIPVILFYLLRDWDKMIRWIGHQVPRRYFPTVQRLAIEIDQVLGYLVRGQLLLMTILGTLYAIGLWLLGLNLALIIGYGAGLVSFVPYLGVITGLVVAGVAIFVQTGDPAMLIWVAVIFGIGQILEQVVLQPLLLGDAIGLHPVWVIFAVLAGGALFGFVGVLLALPAASAVSVLGRFAADRWHHSQAYRG